MIVLAAIVSILLVLLGVLSLPVAFYGRVHLTESLLGEMELALVGGLIRARVAMAGRKPDLSLRLAGLPWFLLQRKPKDPPAHKRTEKNKQGGRRNRSRDKWLELVLNSEVWWRGISYARSVLQSLKLSLRLEGEYGTGDPALTGCLSGFLATLGGGPVELYLCPVFGEPYLDISGELRGRLVPARFMWLTGGFLLIRPVRKLWWPKIGTRNSKSQGGF
ncbi:MAG TPA: DUF2953 domain-containing protein [Spirochaetia bacterium]|nr:DUF2953 domain-containing protein [Spirochaetia bacterium]